MAPAPPPPESSPILNATCAILATTNFTLPSTSNLSACYLTPTKASENFNPSWSILIGFGFIIGILFLYLLSRWLVRRTRRELITELRNTPSYDLHETVERMYAYYYDCEDDHEFKIGLGGRIQKVTSKVEAGKRTVVIIEDLKRQPTAEFIRGRSRSRSRGRPTSRGPVVPPLPPPRRRAQTASLPLAADRTMWPPRPPTPEVAVPPAAAAVASRPRIRFDAHVVTCANGCSAPPYEPPPGYEH